MKEARRTKQCHACNATIMRQTVVCKCGTQVSEILGGGFQSGTYSFVGELPVDDVMPLIGDGSGRNVTVERLMFNGIFVKVRIRDTFAVFKRQPFCVGCGEKAVKWLVVQRKTNCWSINGYNLILVTKDSVPLTIDHILARSKGGKDAMSNYQTMCFGCNNDKDKMSFEEFKQKYHAPKRQHTRPGGAKAPGKATPTERGDLDRHSPGTGGVLDPVLLLPPNYGTDSPRLILPGGTDLRRQDAQ